MWFLQTIHNSLGFFLNFYQKLYVKTYKPYKIYMCHMCWHLTMHYKSNRKKHFYYQTKYKIWFRGSGNWRGWGWLNGGGQVRRGSYRYGSRSEENNNEKYWQVYFRTTFVGVQRLPFDAGQHQYRTDLYNVGLQQAGWFENRNYWICILYHLGKQTKTKVKKQLKKNKKLN